jgi:hypothetical protein
MREHCDLLRGNIIYKQYTNWFIKIFYDAVSTCGLFNSVINWLCPRETIYNFKYTHNFIRIFYNAVSTAEIM